jgi:hypothetical protein
MTASNPEIPKTTTANIPNNSRLFNFRGVGTTTGTDEPDTEGEAVGTVNEPPPLP